MPFENLIGGNVNFAFGKKIGVVMEFSIFRNFTGNFNEIQGGLCFFYRLESLFGCNLKLRQRNSHY